MTTPYPQEPRSPSDPPVVEPYAAGGGPSSSAGEPDAPPQGGTMNPYAVPYMSPQGGTAEPYASPQGGATTPYAVPYGSPQGGTADPYTEPDAQYRAAGQGYRAPAPAKSYASALLLHLFLSGVGAGDFYMGFKKTAFGKLVLNIAGIGMIVASIVMAGMVIADPSFGPYNAKLPTLDQVEALEGAYRLFHVGCWALGLLVVWALISVIMVAARVGMYRADAKGVPLS